MTSWPSLYPQGRIVQGTYYPGRNVQGHIVQGRFVNGNKLSTQVFTFLTKIQATRAFKSFKTGYIAVFQFKIRPKSHTKIILVILRRLQDGTVDHMNQ
jgi:hypothetical protein